MSTPCPPTITLETERPFLKPDPSFPHTRPSKTSQHTQKNQKKKKKRKGGSSTSTRIIHSTLTSLQINDLTAKECDGDGDFVSELRNAHLPVFLSFPSSEGGSEGASEGRSKRGKERKKKFKFLYL